MPQERTRQQRRRNACVFSAHENLDIFFVPIDEGESQYLQCTSKYSPYTTPREKAQGLARTAEGVWGKKGQQQKERKTKKAILSPPRVYPLPLRAASLHSSRIHPHLTPHLEGHLPGLGVLVPQVHHQRPQHLDWDVVEGSKIEGKRFVTKKQHNKTGKIKGRETGRLPVVAVRVSTDRLQPGKNKKSRKSAQPVCLYRRNAAHTAVERLLWRGVTSLFAFSPKKQNTHLTLCEVIVFGAVAVRTNRVATYCWFCSRCTTLPKKNASDSKR